MEVIAKQEQVKKYDSYKPSGVDWLGEIPKHWGVLNLGQITELKSNKNRPDLPVLSVYREFGIIPKDSRDDNHNATSLDTSSYKAVEPGYLVVNKMKAWQGSMGVSQYEGIVSPAYITCKVASEHIDSKFLHQLLRCHLFIGEYNRISYGVREGQWDMHYEDFKKVPIPLPPVPEQTRIADFLDKKTAQIDAAIAKKERLIELLKERRQVMIHKAVTKGLNPNVKMKDSGVDWIGEIPEHWKVSKAKYYSKVFVPERTKPELNESGDGMAWITTETLCQDILTKDSVKQWVGSKEAKKVGSRSVAPNSVLCTCVGNFGIASVNSFPAIVNQQIQGFTSLRIHPLFLVYIIRLSKDHFTINATMTTISYVNKDAFGELPVLITGIQEQESIVKFIERNSAHFDRLVKTHEFQIEKLKELKSTLINSAVTGKIKVSQYA